MTEFNRITKLALRDVGVLREKGVSYGDSWKKRGGTGAYMVGFARKVDRIENICKQYGYDIFKAVRENSGNILDDIQDLRCYLLLIEEEATRPEGSLRANPLTEAEFSNWLKEVKPTGWEGFTFEGADAKGFLYTCKDCHMAVIAQDHQPPRAVHPNCPNDGSKPGAIGYVNQD